MSDDEYAAQSDHEEEEAEPEPEPYVEPEQHHEEESHPPPTSHHDSDYRPEENEGKSEAELRMEMQMKQRKERENEEWAEYEEMRREERQREEEEIQRLREKKEKRKKEREEEERRLAELRAVEEQKRRAEEEERQRRKRAEEEKIRAEREEKKKAANEQKQMVGKRNFVINKKNDGLDVGPSQSQQETAKSKEQLEHEKRAILEQRIQPLQIDGLGLNQLQEKAKDLYHHIYRLEGDKYDLEDRFKRQQYDLMELAERARQMNKGGKQKVQVQQQSEPDPLSDKMSGIPPKITMYSQYERVKDPRSFVDRRDVYSGPLYQDLYSRIAPTHAIVMTDQGPEIAGPYDNAGGPAQNGPPAEEATENVTLEVEE